MPLPFPFPLRTATDCVATGGDAGDNMGGGLYNAGSNLTVQANAIHDNSAAQGGGLYSAGGDLLGAAGVGIGDDLLL